MHATKTEITRWKMGKRKAPIAWGSWQERGEKKAKSAAGRENFAADFFEGIKSRKLVIKKGGQEDFILAVRRCE